MRLFNDALGHSHSASDHTVADPGFDLSGGVDFVNGGGGVENH